MKTPSPNLFATTTLLCLGLSSACLAATLYSTTVIGDKPIVYWNFDETDGDAVQQMALVNKPVTTENDLVPADGAGRVSHAAIGSGLRLGNAADFNGGDFFQAAAMRVGEPTVNGAWVIEPWFQSLGAANVGTFVVNFGKAGGNAPTVFHNL